MAIKKFITSATYDLTIFYNWLNENKSGTFLENMTITLESASSTSSQIAIESENTKISLKVVEDAYNNHNVLSLTGNSTWNFIYKYIGHNESGIKLSGALLCTHGLLIKTYAMYSSSSWADMCVIGIVADSNGDIAYISTTGYANVNSVSGFKTAAYDSTSVPSVTITPQYNATLTSLAPIQPTTGDNSITLQNVYAAIHTQQPSDGLAAVAINGENYITNGRWYIKDE